MPELLDSPSIEGTLRVRRLHVSELDDVHIARWRGLASASCHRNPFLWPEFILPGWRHLSPEMDHELVVVEHPSDQRWLAAGEFSRDCVSRDLPLRHAIASKGSYTFRTGLLLDAEYASAALDALFEFFARSDSQSHGIVFPALRLDSVLVRELSAAARRLGFEWQVCNRRQVPAVFPDIVSEEYLKNHWSASRRKSLRRSRMKLEEKGAVHLRLSRKPDEVGVALETFFRLESDSWKGVEGTAIISDPACEAFVRSMVSGFSQQGNIVISELMAGEQVAASGLNLTVGGALFAFKIGWNSEFANASPGVLHEAELLLESQRELRDFSLFDSCSTEDSYIAPIWPERIPVGTGLILTTRPSRWVRSLVSAGREAKRLILPWW